jgi:hypothetical protein
MNRQNEYNSEGGAVIVFFVAILTVLLGITAFVVDIGFLKWQERHLQNTADAASLAGAREYIDGTPTLVNIKKIVDEYVLLNGVIVTEVESVTLNNVDSPNNNTVTVVLKGKRQLFFGKIFGYHDSSIRVKATAIAAPISGISGLIPFTITEARFTSLSQGQLFHLYKEIDGSAGNWGTINFEPPGSAGQKKLKEWTENGYDGVINIGDNISTSPGAGLNSSNWDSIVEKRADNGDILIIPIVTSISPSGTSTPMPVIGFAALSLTKIVGQGSKIELHATFIDTIEIGEVDPTAPGFKLQGLRLIE